MKCVYNGCENDSIECIKGLTRIDGTTIHEMCIEHEKFTHGEIIK